MNELRRPEKVVIRVRCLYDGVLGCPMLLFVLFLAEVPQADGGDSLCAQEPTWDQSPGPSQPETLGLTGTPVLLPHQSTGQSFRGVARYQLKGCVEGDRPSVWHDPSLRARLDYDAFPVLSGGLFPRAVGFHSFRDPDGEPLDGSTAGNVADVLVQAMELPGLRAKTRDQIVATAELFDLAGTLDEMGAPREAERVRRLVAGSEGPWEQGAALELSEAGHGVLWVQVEDSILNGAGPSWVLMHEHPASGRALAARLREQCGVEATAPEVVGVVASPLMGDPGGQEVIYAVEAEPDEHGVLRATRTTFCLTMRLQPAAARAVKKHALVQGAISGFASAGGLR